MQLTTGWRQCDDNGGRIIVGFVAFYCSQKLVCFQTQLKILGTLKFPKLNYCDYCFLKVDTVPNFKLA